MMGPIRFDTAQTILKTPAAPASPLAGEGSKDSFAGMLKEHLSDVNQLQNSADVAVRKLASGQETDIHNTMIAMEKAGVAFQLTMQVRNKVLEAYQEIMRMQV